MAIKIICDICNSEFEEKPKLIKCENCEDEFCPECIEDNIKKCTICGKLECEDCSWDCCNCEKYICTECYNTKIGQNKEFSQKCPMCGEYFWDHRPW